jgi:hypothetical protein
MTNLITYTDFTGDLILDLNAGEQAQLALYITQFQEEVLTKLLGRNLYATLDVTPAPAKWTELATAGDIYYEYGNYKYKYPGLKRMLACYVYFQWHNLETTSPTPQGQTVDSHLNGTVVINVEKQVRIWNEFVRLYYEIIIYINYKNSIEADYFEDFEYKDIKETNLFGI